MTTIQSSEHFSHWEVLGWGCRDAVHSVGGLPSRCKTWGSIPSPS
ncbi:mCG147657 [Mus musculus]|nr:mCG147657 [Mus musculus]